MTNASDNVRCAKCAAVFPKSLPQCPVCGSSDSMPFKIEGNMNQQSPTAENFREVHSRETQKDVLTRIPPKVSPSKIRISPDLQRIAYALKDSIVIDGHDVKSITGIESVVFSPDSKHRAYIIQAGGKKAIIIDGQEHFVSSGLGVPVFSPNGQHTAFSARVNDKWCVVVDGKPGPQYEMVDHRIVFSPNSAHLAYRAGQGAEQFIVLDGEKGPPYARTGENSLVFSPDNSRFAYAAGRTRAEWFYTIDEKAGLTHAVLAPLPLSFSPDSSHFAYAFISERTQVVVLDHAVYDHVWGSVTNLLFSPDSMNLYYSYSSGGICDVKLFSPTMEQPLPGTKGGVYSGTSTNYLGDSIDSMAFTPDGARLLCVCVPQGTWQNPSGLIPSFVWALCKPTRKAVYVLHGIGSPSTVWDYYFKVSNGEVFSDILFVDSKQLFFPTADTFSYLAYQKSERAVLIVTETLE